MNIKMNVAQIELFVVEIERFRVAKIKRVLCMHKGLGTITHLCSRLNLRTNLVQIFGGRSLLPLPFLFAYPTLEQCILYV